MSEKTFEEYENKKLAAGKIIDAETVPSAHEENKTGGEESSENGKGKSLAIPIGKNGLVQARDNAELMRYCGALVHGGGVPERFSTPQKLFAALMFVRDLKLPDTSIRQVAVIHGVPSIFGDLPLTLAQRTGEVTYLEEFWFDKDYNRLSFDNKNLAVEAYGSSTIIERRSTGHQSFSFTLDDARKAGLYPSKKPGMPWQNYTKLMLRYKARSIALKSLFADAISGCSIAEYDYNQLPEFKDVTPTQTKEDVLAKIRESGK